MDTRTITDIVIALATLIAVVVSVRKYSIKIFSDKIDSILDIEDIKHRVDLLEQKVEIVNNSFAKELHEIKQEIVKLSEYIVGKK
jgi:tetrahydromethanopterin S-methyltransferase subunit G